MIFTKEEVLQYVEEEDVKFVRLAFCDLYGKQKNISILADELDRAFRYGIAIDGSAIAGFDTGVHSDLILHPDPSTLSVLPWRPENGKVVRMFATITHPDGTPFSPDTRYYLMKAVERAGAEGIRFAFGSEMEFYLFRLGPEGEKTKIPFDTAGYMDVAPEDKGENVRREICLTLERMGIHPESSHHEEGPGQNEIDFRYSDPLRAADDAITFKTVVETVAMRNGLWACFSAKPLENEAGNGMHINFSVKNDAGTDVMPMAIAGILKHIQEITLFLNSTEESYLRFGSHKAPRFVSWSNENRSQLIRIPAAEGEYRRAELRSPDPMCNPYIAYALLIYAALDGIRCGELPDAPSDINLFALSDEEKKHYRQLPCSKMEARDIASHSEFLKTYLPAEVLDHFLK